MEVSVTEIKKGAFQVQLWYCVTAAAKTRHEIYIHIFVIQ
jgi:hypothetical protein